MSPLRISIAALALLASACTTVPFAPDPTINLSGHWSIVAVNGEPTGGDRKFNFDLKPTYGLAQFGCNTGSGSYVVQNGWFFGGSRWIITAARCLDPGSWLEFERNGFQILSKPLAIERRSGNVIRLRNELGSIDIWRA